MASKSLAYHVARLLTADERERVEHHLGVGVAATHAAVPQLGRVLGVTFKQ